MPNQRNKDKKYYSMWMDESDLKSLDELAKDRKTTRNEVINQLIREKIKSKKAANKAK